MTMKIFIPFVMVFILFAVPGCTSERDHAESAASAEEYYTCPMHPSVRSDRPGACPVCGMALIRKSSMKEADSKELADLRRISLSSTQRVLANISVLPAVKSRILKDIAVSGIVDVSEPRLSSITARFRGRIEALFVSFSGQRVARGEPLFSLYSPDLASAQQDYLLAFKSVQIAMSDQFSSGSTDVLRSARERLRTHYGMTDPQVNELESSGKVRSTITFHAPFSGTVLEKTVVQGQYVDEGTALYQLADLSQVWVYLDIYEQDLPFVRHGLDVELTSDAFPGKTFQGRVAFIDPVVNPETRSVRVRTESANPKHLLKPGMFMRAQISVLLDPAVVVPTSSILSTGMRDVVWVEVYENAFEPRSITKGITAGNLTQVLTGLREGESVAVTGGYLIDSESSLQMAPGPHEGHASPSASSAERGTEVSLHVKGSYSPNVIKAQKNVPLRIRIFRDEESSCTEEIVFSDFGVRQTLKAFDTTIVSFTPDRGGTFTFSCGMDMIHGTLVVE